MDQLRWVGFAALALCLGAGCGDDAGERAAHDAAADSGGAQDAAREPRPFRILLSNDDGWSATGLQTLRAVLLGAGHDVTTVAPAGERSGSGTNLSFGDGELVEQEPGLYSLEASPATCVFAGLALLEGEVDLVVSGNNEGVNAGGSYVVSGTMGAAAAALYQGVPSLAVSAAEPDGVEHDSEAFRAHFSALAEHVLPLVTRLAERAAAGEPVLPDAMGLAVNYPDVPVSELPPLTVATQSMMDAVQAMTEGGSVVELDTDDWGFLQDGRPTISPFRPSFGAKDLSPFVWLEHPLSEQPGAPLDIALMAEDPASAPGVAILLETLRAAGHRVIALTPDTSTTGGGTLSATTYGCTQDQTAPDEFTINTPPSICASQVAAKFAPDDYDLFISGINDGDHEGGLLTWSGAVGPAILAVSRTQHPAIAIHSNPPDAQSADAHYQEVADWLLRLISTLQANWGVSDTMPYGLLPAGHGLSIHYPPNASGTAAVTEPGVGSPWSYAWQGGGKLMTTDGLARTGAERSDASVVAAGGIAITPIAPDWNGSDADRAFTTELIEDLHP
jgi:5'-nucleotidase